MLRVLSSLVLPPSLPSNSEWWDEGTRKIHRSFGEDYKAGDCAYALQRTMSDCNDLSLVPAPVTVMENSLEFCICKFEFPVVN